MSTGMHKWPDRTYEDAGAFLDSYADLTCIGWKTVDRGAVRRAAECLTGAAIAGANIFSCGNGGSASIANHLVCDHLKGVRTNTTIAPRPHSLSSNIELITAVANDISYENVFVYQLQSLAARGDVLVAISSSGNSPNILSALDWANSNGLTTIAMTGFGGGKARQLAQVALHVAVENYGVVEDIHQSLMHVLAQFLRQGHLTNATHVGELKF